MENEYSQFMKGSNWTDTQRTDAYGFVEQGAKVTNTKRFYGALLVENGESLYLCALINRRVINWLRRDAWVAERNSLLNCRTGNGTEGSNPSLSAALGYLV